MASPFGEWAIAWTGFIFQIISQLLITLDLSTNSQTCVSMACETLFVSISTQWMELALKFHEKMRKTMQTDPDASENSWAEQTTMSIQKFLKIAKSPLEGNIRQPFRQELSGAQLGCLFGGFVMGHLRRSMDDGMRVGDMDVWWLQALVTLTRKPCGAYVNRPNCFAPSKWWKSFYAFFDHSGNDLRGGHTSMIFKLGRRYHFQK